LNSYQILVLPGGFTYGDDVAAGKILALQLAHFLGDALRRFRDEDKLILGICNGFQVLCEAGLLPGALMRNSGLKYVCKAVHVRVESSNTPYTQQLTKGEVLEIPIGHMDGNYFCDEHTLAQLKIQDRIIFRYTDSAGRTTRENNPNGSIENIAGICSEGRNVLGMMPHPERAAAPELGMTDGAKIFHSLVAAMVTK